MRKSVAEKRDSRREARRHKLNGVMDELDRLECKQCENWIDLRKTSPEKESWVLVGFGVWECNGCKKQ